MNYSFWTDCDVESWTDVQCDFLSCRTKTETGRRPSEANSEDAHHVDKMLVTLTALWVISRFLQLEDWQTCDPLQGLFKDFYSTSRTFQGTLWSVFFFRLTYYFALYEILNFTVFSNMIQTLLKCLTILFMGFCFLINTTKKLSTTLMRDLLLYWLNDCLFRVSGTYGTWSKKHTTYERQVCTQKLCVINV